MKVEIYTTESTRYHRLKVPHEVFALELVFIIIKISELHFLMFNITFHVKCIWTWNGIRDISLFPTWPGRSSMHESIHPSIRPSLCCEMVTSHTLARFSQCVRTGTCSRAPDLENSGESVTVLFSFFLNGLKTVYQTCFSWGLGLSVCLRLQNFRFIGFREDINNGWR